MFVEANWIFGCISILQNIYAICVNQSILKISPGCSLEGLMLKLKLQYFGQLMWRVDSLEKTLMLGGIGAGREGDDKGWDGWMASPTWWTWIWVNSGSWWWSGRPGVLQFMGSQRVRHDWATELNWTELCQSDQEDNLNQIRNYVDLKTIFNLFRPQHILVCLYF